MKYYVYKKRYVRSISNLAILDLIIISLCVISFVFMQMDDVNLFMLIVLIPFSIICNLAAIPIIISYGSLVTIEENIKCVFGSRVRRTIDFDEINDYGIFWFGRTKFIYVSRIVLTEVQKNTEAFLLYRKTKDVIVFEYQEKVIDCLESRCPLSWDGSSAL